MKRFYTCLLVIGLSYSLAIAQSPAPVFENPADVFTESGYVQLSWDLDPTVTVGKAYHFELEQDTEEFFATPKQIYRGPDFATFLSGLKDGHYYYRVRLVADAGSSAWSDPVMVRVEHHSLSLAFTLFGLGAVVFLLTVGIIVQGNRRAAQNL